MPRNVALHATLTMMAVATALILTGCTGAIHTAPLPSSGAKLTPNPPHIYVAPFNNDTAKWMVGREGVELVNFKQDFQGNFSKQLVNRLQKLAPSEARWIDDLPDNGWLIAGDFITVDQGSRALRAAVGAGYGETTLQTTVYVYDLSVSKTEYILSFKTGMPDAKQDTGAGSGSSPGFVAGGGVPGAAIGVGSGLKLDTTRTCREIVSYLQPYIQ